jgi:glutamate-1-semialdehyde 2,1-aminomutase
VPGTEGIAPEVVAATVVVPFNDLDALERVLRTGDIACFIVEPVMENIGICLPDDGYLRSVRDLTSRHGTVLIFDEVKTGITAGYGGATGYFGVEPDLVTLAKSIGGGFPIGAFGGKRELMDLITAGRVLHLGTYNGNPLVMAAARATLAEACDRPATDEAIARNARLVASCQAVIDDAGLPAHTVQFGAKGCVTWRRQRVRNYRDYRDGHIELAFSQWIHGINRGILLPPGLDEQWLISVMHDDTATMRYADVFGEFAAELTA